MNAEHIVNLLLEAEPILKRLTAGAVGFGGFMKPTQRGQPHWSPDSLGKTWEYEHSWPHAGDITIRVYDFGPGTTRPDTMTISMDWTGQFTTGVHKSSEFWDMSKTKRVQVVYILKECIALIEKTMNEVEARVEPDWGGVFNFQNEALVKDYAIQLFDHITNEVRHIESPVEV